MELGVFSISLAVKDIGKSKEFYKKLGFKKMGGDQSQNWLIMKNGPHIVGLFQGMFESNILTFNPGWDNNSNELDTFTDVRVLYREIESKGIEITSGAIEEDRGPSSFAIQDPDGNTILIDQHV